MRTIETKVFQYDELNERAQARARDWWREASAGDDFIFEQPTEEFRELLAILGWHVDAKRGITWSGFWSQGDGAAFGGTWYAADVDAAKVTAWMADRPRSFERDGKTEVCRANVRWHDAIEPILALRRKFPCGSGSVALGRGNNILRNSFEYDNEETGESLTGAAVEEAERALCEAATDLASAFYRALEEEYEWANADEQVADNIRANEYEFTEEGRRF